MTFTVPGGVAEGDASATLTRATLAATLSRTATCHSPAPDSLQRMSILFEAGPSQFGRLLGECCALARSRF